MRVLQINSVCGTGSTGRIVTDIHHSLLEQGHESYIAYGRGTPKKCNDPIKIGTKLDNYKHGVMTRVFDRHGFGSRKATIEFINRVKEIDPDIIHLHNIHGYYINIDILFDYLKSAKKSVIWTLHDCWSFTGHCAYFEQVGCVKWKTGCYSCPQKKQYPKSLLFDNSNMNYSSKKNIFTGVEDLVLTGPSRWLERTVNESFLKEYPMNVINNGIDLNVFKPRKSDFREKNNLKNKKIILGVANVWEDRKGYQTFIELSKMIDENTVIIMVGLNKAQLNNLPENIFGMERTTNQDELVGLYSTADVCANPSTEETFGLVTVESMACGTPVVVYNATASPEIVNDELGAVVEKDNIQEFANAVNKILDEGKEAYKNKCVDTVRAKYDKENVTNKMLKLYKNVLENDS